MDGETIVLDTDGTVTTIDLPADDRLTAMRTALRCRLVDVVALTNKLDMWLDDEGMYNHPVNPYATELARQFGFVHQDYYGPVLLCAVTSDGDSVNLTTDQSRAVRGQVREILASVGDLP
ncbi:DUF3846 domain-containing protein [Actinopolymorpha sp. B11F2]|uniref:DUF3846 domain-containing protein n=1 Tax=Actinopolymorpha sp. B11F2 TaxID=3160862 RepID=UPI0032E37E04